MRGPVNSRRQAPEVASPVNGLWKSAAEDYFLGQEKVLRPEYSRRDIDARRDIDTESMRSGASGQGYISSQQVSSLAGEIQALEARCEGLESRNAWLNTKVLQSKNTHIASMLNLITSTTKRSCFDAWRKVMMEDHLEFQLNQQTESLDQCQKVAKDLGTALAKEQDLRGNVEANLQSLREEIRNVTVSNENLQQHIAEQQARARHLERQLREAENHMGLAHNDAMNVGTHVSGYDRKTKELDVQHKQALDELRRSGQYTALQVMEAQSQGGPSSQEQVMESRRSRSEAKLTLRQVQGLLPNGGGGGGEVREGRVRDAQGYMRDRTRDTSPERAGFMYDENTMRASHSVPALSSGDNRGPRGAVYVQPPLRNSQSDLRMSQEMASSLPEVTGMAARRGDMGNTIEYKYAVGTNSDDGEYDHPDGSQVGGQDRLASWALKGGPSVGRSGNTPDSSNSPPARGPHQGGFQLPRGQGFSILDEPGGGGSPTMKQGRGSAQGSASVRPGPAPMASPPHGGSMQLLGAGPMQATKVIVPGSDVRASRASDRALSPGHHIFNALDRNHDGVVTRAEFEAAFGQATAPAPSQTTFAGMAPGTMPAVAKAAPGNMVFSPQRIAIPSLAARAVPMPLATPSIPVAAAPTGQSFTGTEPWWAVRRGPQSPSAG